MKVDRVKLLFLLGVIQDTYCHYSTPRFPDVDKSILKTMEELREEIKSDEDQEVGQQLQQG